MNKIIFSLVSFLTFIPFSFHMAYANQTCYLYHSKKEVLQGQKYNLISLTLPSLYKKTPLTEVIRDLEEIFEIDLNIKPPIGEVATVVLPQRLAFEIQELLAYSYPEIIIEPEIN